MKTVLLTGIAGFIGYHFAESLLSNGYNVIGVDNINDYYDVNLKFDRLKLLGFDNISDMKLKHHNISVNHGKKLKLSRIDISNLNDLEFIFDEYNIDYVCNLAAQAGVRYSIENPHTYVNSNITGFLNIMECCKKYKIKKLVYASSSSVYGNSSDKIFKESAIVNSPVSMYAATKISNELIASTYSNLYGIETIGLRFFTVYGPWGRPDMALFLFVDAILNNKPIKVFNNGNLSRDFTYISDIINGMMNIFKNIDKENKNICRVYNIGNGMPVNLMDFIKIIEKELNKKSIKIMLPMQPGDVGKTSADITRISNEYRYSPKVDINIGVKNFVAWFLKYYKNN